MNTTRTIARLITAADAADSGTTGDQVLDDLMALSTCRRDHQLEQLPRWCAALGVEAAR